MAGSDRREAQRLFREASSLRRLASFESNRDARAGLLRMARASGSAARGLSGR